MASTSVNNGAKGAVSFEAMERLMREFPAIVFKPHAVLVTQAVWDVLKKLPKALDNGAMVGVAGSVGGFDGAPDGPIDLIRLKTYDVRRIRELATEKGRD